MSMTLTFGHSETGRVETMQIETTSVQLSYGMLRDENDTMLAEFDRGLWRRHDTGTFWTDVSIATTHEMSKNEISARLEYLRGELRAERMSWGELHELQGLAEHIDPGDVELLEAAGVPEHDDA